MVTRKTVSLAQEILPKEFLHPGECQDQGNGSDSTEDDEVEIQLTPRSCTACEMQGIMPEELVYLPMSNFKKKGLMKEQIIMRYNHHESRRRGE